MENCENFNKYCYNLFPGLCNSTEVFFGRNAPLAQILLKHSKNLKELIEPAKNYSDKKFIAELYKELNFFNDEVCKEINVERVQICVNPDDKEDNAGAYPMYFGSNLTFTEKNKGKISKYLDFDKIVDLEDIVIIPNVGYKYRNPKGKIVIISINTCTIKKCSVEEIAGTLAHEIGHCFQDGIFGVYKDLADKSIGASVAGALAATNPITSASPIKSFANILAYIFWPKTLIEGVFNVLSGFFAKLNLSSLWKNQNDNKTYLMKDQLRRLDNGESDELFDNYSGNGVIADYLIDVADSSRDKFADQIYDEHDEKLKSYSSKNKNTPLEKKTNALYNFFRSIFVDFNLVSSAGLRVLKLSNYTPDKLMQLTFFKKYEYFADIFATSYGFGPELYKNTRRAEFNAVNDFIQKDLVGINNISLFRVGYLNRRLKEIRNFYTHDVHSVASDRGKAIYTALAKELESNRSLTSKQKEEIQEHLNQLRAADEAFLKDRDQDGFWVKYFGSVIDDQIDGIKRETEEEILEPIERIVKESLKNPKKK